jgi:hypothetical protein
MECSNYVVEKTVRLPFNLIKVIRDTNLIYELKQIRKLAESLG